MYAGARFYTASVIVEPLMLDLPVGTGGGRVTIAGRRKQAAVNTVACPNAVGAGFILQSLTAPYRRLDCSLAVSLEPEPGLAQGLPG